MSFVKGTLKRLLALLCFMSATASTTVANLTDNAAQLLRQSVEAPKTVSYIGQLQTVRFAGNGASATLARVEHKAPAFTRRWFLAPEALYGDYIITLSSRTYRFETKRARIVISENPALADDTFAENRLDLMLRNYRPVFDDVEVIANHATDSILLINKYTGERMIRLWIDRQTHLILRKEEFHGNGSVASQVRFEAIRYTQNIPTDLFNVQTPNGFTRVEGYTAQTPSANLDDVIRTAGFTPYKPQDLPQGFLLTSASAIAPKGIKTIHLTYTDGLRTLSLFENNKGASANFGELRPRTIHFEGHEAHYIEDGPTTLLTWEKRGIHFALVGDLAREELVQIASSIVP
jgi:Domain of unknown function (DUF4367)/MucB/RseB N-terminal domain